MPAQDMKTDIQALIFDVDGVVTKTAQQHAAAWKQVFDPVLENDAARKGEPYVPFDEKADYLRYVDGKPRREGILSFLHARSISLSEAEIKALEEDKYQRFGKLLEEQGIQTYPSTMALVREARQHGVVMAVVTSSRRGREILESAGMSDQFDAIFDGTDVDHLHLAGKPHPDMFLHAASALGVPPSRAVVIEDAVAGVQAGRCGEFGLVVGLNRADHAAALESGGADVVVRDLEELPLGRLESAFLKKQNFNAWHVRQKGFERARERQMESLFCIGNGYLGVRGALDTPLAWSQPDLFVAGIYDEKSADLPYSEIEFLAPDRGGNRYAELVPLPFPFRVGIAVGGVTLDQSGRTSFELERLLDMQKGMLHLETRFETADGRKTTVRSRRCASLADSHLLLQEVAAIRENHWCNIAFTPSLLEPDLATKHPHLQVQRHVRSTEQELVCYRTKGSGFLVAIASVYRRGGTSLQRTCFVYTSNDCPDPAAVALERAGNFEWNAWESCFAESANAWAAYWRKADIRIPSHPSVEQALRFGSYHLRLSAPPDPTVSVGARTLSGRAYEGHIFWDAEIFMLPFYVHVEPEIARRILLYRHHTLAGARHKARQLGYAGACFAWESTLTGDEVTPSKILLKSTGKEIPIFTGTEQIHVTAAVAYAVWRYWECTRDQAFLEGPGAVLLFETARFWSSRVSWKNAVCHIRGVVGPDEYHHSVTDNAYTNWMARFNLERAAWLARAQERHLEEAKEWEAAAQALHVPSPNEEGVIEQFEGFFALADYTLEDAARFRAPIARLFAWDKVNQLKLIKQADVLMLPFLFPAAFTDEIVAANYRYYEPLTDHGSSLSPAVHAALAARLGWQEEAERYWKQSLWLDLSNGMDNSMLGVHAAAMAGSWQALLFGFLGVHFDETGPHVAPRAGSRMPDGWSRVGLNLAYRGNEHPVKVMRNEQ